MVRRVSLCPCVRTYVVSVVCLCIHKQPIPTPPHPENKQTDLEAQILQHVALQLVPVERRQGAEPAVDGQVLRGDDLGKSAGGLGPSRGRGRGGGDSSGAGSRGGGGLGLLREVVRVAGQKLMGGLRVAALVEEGEPGGGLELGDGARIVQVRGVLRLRRLDVLFWWG